MCISVFTAVLVLAIPLLAEVPVFESGAKVSLFTHLVKQSFRIDQISFGFPNELLACAKNRAELRGMQGFGCGRRCMRRLVSIALFLEMWQF